MNDAKRQIDITDKLILKILSDNKEPMEIHDLFDKVVAKDPISEYEFKYAFSHHLSTGKIKMGFEGIVSLNNMP